MVEKETIYDNEFLAQIKQDIENTEHDLKTSRLNEAIVRQENVFVILGEVRRLVRKTSGKAQSHKIIEELTTKGYTYSGVLSVSCQLFDL